MISRHDLAPSEFAALAGGYGGPDAVRSLMRAQLSKHLLLMKFIANRWQGDPVRRDRAVTVLAAAQRAAADAVGDMLTDPLIGAWAARVTRRLSGSLTSDVPLSVECEHLASIAAAAAALACTDTELFLLNTGGGVIFPRLGRVQLPQTDLAPVLVRVHSGRIFVDGEIGREDLHRLEATAGDRSLRVSLDDLNPYRGGHHAPPSARLAAAEVSSWQRVFTDAWDLVATYAPARADELAVGLRTLVPLTRLDEHSARSATIRDAFGAFGLTRPTTAVDLAVMLVHEFQHSKLSGVLDIQALLDPDSTELYFAPWRTDPRPVGGLMQGVYAFLGVADLWQRLRGCQGLEARAELEFAVVREQVVWALSSLEGSAALTDAGRCFIEGMRGTVEALAAEPLPAGVIQQARDALHGNLDAWRRRNAAALRG